MTPEQEIVRAGEARQILDSPVFIDARKAIEAQLSLARRNVPITQTDMHTRIILMEQLWGSLLNFFEQLATTGRMAQMKLDDEQRQRSFLERGLAVFRTTGRSGI